MSVTHLVSPRNTDHSISLPPILGNQNIKMFDGRREEYHLPDTKLSQLVIARHIEEGFDTQT